MGYIDSFLDIMNKEEGVVFKLPAEEILFFGPDENTADKMDLACHMGKDRGYKFYKGISTGKSTSLGGIPHDT